MAEKTQPIEVARRIAPVDAEVVRLDETPTDPAERAIVERAVAHINGLAGDMVLRAYEIGRYVLEDVLLEGRAPYGKRIVERIAAHKDLAVSRSSLFNCISLARAYPELRSGTVPTRLTGLGLSHLYVLSRIVDDEDRDWFERRCRKKSWTVRRLEEYCALHDYRRPADRALEDDEDDEDDEARPRGPLLRLESGRHDVESVMEQLQAVGPASFRVTPSHRQFQGWDRVFVDCGLGTVRVEDLCLLRAFVEIAASRGPSEVTLTREGRSIQAQAGGLRLEIECEPPQAALEE